MTRNHWTLLTAAVLLTASGCTGSTTFDGEQSAEPGVRAVTLKVHGFKKSTSGAT